MKKRLINCEDCGVDNSILTQISSGPEVILLCADCYNLKYSNEVKNENNHIEEKKIKNLIFMGWENSTTLSLNFSALVLDSE
jgi:excinuclease UvrABC ATPase subunit|tara:strand:+ start:341 stop:586 length:246 start_codon:yes stop_codon:yes gene_type:complete